VSVAWRLARLRDAVAELYLALAYIVVGLVALVVLWPIWVSAWLGEQRRSGRP